MERDTTLKVNRNYVERLVENGERLDGRAFDEYRDIDIEAGYVRETAEGSAMVEMGDTKLLVGVKAKVDSPYSDSPDQGVLVTNVELVPIAATEYEAGPPRQDAVELARVVDRGLRESGIVDLTDLSIKEGEKCWTVFVDVHVLDYDGNLLDASFLGAVTALKDSVLPLYDEEEDELDREERGEDLPTHGHPVTLTGRKIGDQVVLDTTGEEEDVTSSRLTVTLNDDDNVVSLQKGGRASMSHEETMQIVDYTQEKADMLREAVEDAL